eukprot:scaffold12256_cov67-Phaeocystis_antarctica.AAC.3
MVAGDIPQLDRPTSLWRAAALLLHSRYTLVSTLDRLRSHKHESEDDFKCSACRVFCNCCVNRAPPRVRVDSARSSLEGSARASGHAGRGGRGRGRGHRSAVASGGRRSGRRGG